MIHNWAQDIHVRPRNAVLVEENGRLISNYILLKIGWKRPDLSGGDAQRSWSRSAHQFHPGGASGVGAGYRRAGDSRGPSHSCGAHLAKRHRWRHVHQPRASHRSCAGCESASRMPRTHPFAHGNHPRSSRVGRPGRGGGNVPRSSGGRIAAEEIECPMARGLDEDEAVSAIVRGFLKVKIEGLPPALEEEIEQAIQETGRGL